LIKEKSKKSKGMENIIRVPVKGYVFSFLKSRFPLKNGVPFIDLMLHNFLETSISNFVTLNAKKNENFFPEKNEPFIYLKTRKNLGFIGLNELDSKRLGAFIAKYAIEAIFQDTFYYQSLPGISVSEALLIVLAKYEMEDVVSLSFRRQFDRMSFENKLFKVDRYSVNHRINHALKKIYDEKFVKSLNQK
jgi:hypothetical protein